MKQTMNDEDMTLEVPKDWTASEEMIKVIGVGGGGCNAVTFMFNQHVQGCSFIVCNTDSQALKKSTVPVKIQMGTGLGAGTDPTIGRNAALESQDKIAKILLDSKTKMVFITAGMGGGTGTGAAPVIAKMAKDKGMLTVAVVTLPFDNEGNGAKTKAINGILELEKNVDSLIVIDNEKLHDFYGNLRTHEAYPKVDEVLSTAVQGIVEIIQKPGFVNVDFRDVYTMMKDSSMALMGCGSGKGENKIDDAVRQALESPLLNNYNLREAKNVLINITCAHNDQDLTMDELKVIGEKIKEYTGNANNFKRGLIYDDNPDADDTVHITAIVTGLKFSEVSGTGVSFGDIIMIDKNYTYDSSSKIDGFDREVEFPDDADINVIGITTSKIHKPFNFEKRPALLIKEGGSIAALENEPAIRRSIVSNE